MTLHTHFIVTLILGLFLHVQGDNVNQHAPVVQTALGGLKGVYIPVKGKESGVHAFLGVPFAYPPVGPELRLAPPRPVQAWNGVKDATKQPPMCVQNVAVLGDLYTRLGMEIDVPGISEDCLCLNIYTPANTPRNAKLPVMVWIHGGGFTHGAASSYDGSALSAYEDVVVVMIQYRLGLLGFLSTGEKGMAGNFGLLDQVEALKWVQQHIHNFGGNPDQVTIFGESAGGMSVSFLYLSPLSNGLFHRGIAESGTAVLLDTLVADPLGTAKMAANMSGCSLESTETISNCMRNLDLQKIVELTEVPELVMSVTIDGLFLTKPVSESLRNHEIQKLPFMTGVNSDEGGWLLPTFMAPPNWTEGMTRDEVKGILSLFYTAEHKDEALNLIIDEFTGKSEDPKILRKAFTDTLGDLIFNVPAVKTINAHTDVGAPVYVYEYNFSPRMLKKVRPEFVGADHADEIFAVLGICFTTTHVRLIEECSKEEEELNRRVMRYWANFAYTGSPNGKGLVHWPQYGKEENYLFIDSEQVVRQGLRKDHVVFLTQTLPKMLEELEKTEHIEL
ncbi:cocaine esterase-like [Boleophthalmus pectinirostris]|uniref:cocaine esterase-like n=1 Tax=Boleophthalmus pectinirostris TaxID=150288 RepID=UPI002432F557|nr:cocaine esterase-like [Boleophthalmus pectinirostris]